MTQVGPTFSSKLPCKKEAEGDLTTWWGGGGPVIVTAWIKGKKHCFKL